MVNYMFSACAPRPRNALLALLGATALTGCASDRYGYYDPYDNPYGNEVPIVSTGTATAVTPIGATRNTPAVPRRHNSPAVGTPYATNVSLNRANISDFAGYEGSRYAHQAYSEAFAETVDGQCEEVVTVRYGDTLSDIAEYCDTSVSALIGANGSIRNPRNLRVGQAVYIPRVTANVYDGYVHTPRRYAPGLTPRPAARPAIRSAGYDDREVYIVRRGDTIADIASDYGVSVRSIYALNPGVSPYDLEIGERIVLPKTAIHRPLPAQPIADPLPRTPRIADGADAPVVIYINSRGSRGDRAVISIDSDAGVSSRAPGTYRLVPERVASQTVGPNLRAGTYGLERVSAGTYDHMVPSSLGGTSTTAAPSEPLGVACLSVASGSARVYETSLVDGRPSCGYDQTVRLYRSR
jgi:LysM repeat protein